MIELTKCQQEEVEEKLLSDPAFIMRAIERTAQVLSSSPAPEFDREGHHRPTIEENARRDARERSQEVDKKIEDLRSTPKLRDKSKLLKAWRALGVIMGVSTDLMCPTCNDEIEIALKCSRCGETSSSELGERINQRIRCLR